MKYYGYPYMGSKRKIVKDIIDALPTAKNFYDLFAGGCAVTHYALGSGKYKNVIANDIQSSVQLFIDAVGGKYKNEKRWISREQFHAEKATDLYIRWIWSFGNNGSDYLFGKDAESLKKSAHEYLFKNGYDGTKEKRIALIKQFKADKKIIGRFELERLEQLERLQQLERLERLRQLEYFNVDYRKVKIEPRSIIYCDPPYPHKGNTKEKYYGIGFDTDAFYKWVAENKHPVYFSSVEAPKRFKVVWSKATQCTMNNKNSHGKKEIVERLYWNGVLCT